MNLKVSFNAGTGFLLFLFFAWKDTADSLWSVK